MSTFRKHRSIAAAADHALVEADQRFQTAIAQAIAVGGERVEALKATVDLKRRTPLDTKSAPLVWVDNVATGNGGVRYRIWQGRQSLTRDGRHTREIWMVWRQTASGSRRRCIGAVDTLEQARALAKSDHAGGAGARPLTAPTVPPTSPRKGPWCDIRPAAPDNRRMNR